MSETLDYRLGLVPEIRLPIGADFAVEFTFTGLTLTGYTGNFTARKSNRKSTNPYFWSSSTVTIGANSASVSFAADDEDANDKPFSTVATLNGTDYALTLYDDGAIVLRLQGKITWIDRTGAFESVTPANASFAVAVGESVAIPVTVTMASEGGAFDLPAAIHAATAKNSIAGNDEFAISDSAASWGLKKVTWNTIRTAVSGLITTAINALGLGNSATRNIGTTAGTVAAGDDSRLTDARTPTAHKASHATGGADALTAADIGALPASSVSAFGASLIDDADAAAARTTLGITVVDLASPGPIGETTASTGRFTTVKATGDGTFSEPAIAWKNGADGLSNIANNLILKFTNTAQIIFRHVNGFHLRNEFAAAPITWGSVVDNISIGTITNALEPISANILAVKNGSAAQKFRTYGDSTKYAQLEHNGTDAILSSSSGKMRVTALCLDLVTVATLPAAASNARARYEVSDALLPSLGATVASGGAVTAEVRSNGTNWIVTAIF